MSKISVLLVDDSSVIRGVLSRILETIPDVEIVGSVSNGQMGVTIAQTRQPDVVILDIEMPVMDGLAALPEILKHSPKSKVVMCSSLTAKGADITMKAMALGAVECIVKPSSAQETGPNSLFQTTLINLVRSLGAKSSSVQSRAQSAVESMQRSVANMGEKPHILAIGSSTGGPQALFQTLKDVGKLTIPIVITQHMPATFTTILAKHIGQQTGLESFEGAEGMVVEAGKVYVAPGGKHMLFERSGTQIKIKLDDGPVENFCKPAVDPMLRSLISLYGSKILCVILTGMGHDGLEGSRLLKDKGGRIVAQDEATSVVWGMPGAVTKANLCSAVLPLNDIGSWVRKVCV